MVERKSLSNSVKFSSSAVVPLKMNDGFHQTRHKIAKVLYKNERCFFETLTFSRILFCYIGIFQQALLWSTITMCSNFSASSIFPSLCCDCINYCFIHAKSFLFASLCPFFGSTSFPQAIKTKIRKWMRITATVALKNVINWIFHHEISIFNGVIMNINSKLPEY